MRAARDGARIAIAAKTETPHPKLEGTIHSAAEMIRAAGGEALPLAGRYPGRCGGRSSDRPHGRGFWRLDIVVNNASAIHLAPARGLDMKRFDLMHQVNARGSFLVSKIAIPHLQKAANPHILMLSPPLEMKEKWFAPHTAYSMAKFGMSLVVLGLAGELRSAGVAVNALWPRSTIATAAIRNLLGGEAMIARLPHTGHRGGCGASGPEAPSRALTGQFLIDEGYAARGRA